MKRALLLLPLLSLAACVTQRPAYFHHGVEKSLDEYLQAEAACERKVGGMDYPSAFAVCMREAGWKRTVVYE